MQIWIYKNADERKQTFSRKKKNETKQTKTGQKRIPCKPEVGKAQLESQSATSQPPQLRKLRCALIFYFETLRKLRCGIRPVKFVAL